LLQRQIGFRTRFAFSAYPHSKSPKPNENLRFKPPKEQPERAIDRLKARWKDRKTNTLRAFEERAFERK